MHPAIADNCPAGVPHHRVVPTATQASVPSSATACRNIRDKAFNPTILVVSYGHDCDLDHQRQDVPPGCAPAGAGQDEAFHSDRLDPSQSFSYTFTKPGRYEYSDPQFKGH